MSKIQINCEWCGKSFLCWEYRNRKFCSHSCGANSRMSDPEYKKKLYTEERNRKVRESQKGRTYNEDQIERMRQAAIGRKLSEETKRKIGNKVRGEKNGNYGKKLSQEIKDKISLSLIGRSGVRHTEETKRQISETLKGQPFSEERKQKISDKLFESFKNGTWKPYTGFFQGCYNGQFYDSSYELARFMQLDDLNQEYTKRHSIRIKYTINERSRWYYPDILTGTVLEEIKPLSRVCSEENKSKFLAAEDYCKQHELTFRIITENDLGDYIDKARNFHKNNLSGEKHEHITVCH
jgi:hypothetical protein